MKIALIHRFYSLPGGVTTIVDQLATGLKNNFEIISQYPSKKKFVKQIRARSTLGFYWKSLIYLKKNKFDIIHTHSSFAAFFSPFLKEKVILTVHGFEKTYDSKNWWTKVYENYILCKLKILSYHCADVLITPSILIKKHLINSYHIPSRKIVVISNGTDTDVFRPQKISQPKVPEIFQHGISRRKGFDKVVKWSRILSKDRKFKIIVAGTKGSVPNDLMPFFQFIGDVPKEELVKVYNRCSFGLLPSLCDPFGLTVTEIMACGKPAIVSPFVGAKDVITNGVDGIVCNFKDFPKKIKFLLDNPDVANRMGQLSRKKIISIASSEIMIKEHLKLYKELSS